MRLSRLDLLAYGRFTDVQLPLGPGFHLVYGPNEAGKSTTLRAIRQLLFGFDERTNDNFVHSNPNLRLGGIICDDAGNELHVIRRKARKDSLRAAVDESVIDSGLWQKILSGIDEPTFSQRYGIDYEQLIKGGHEIATGSGDLGEILFATGSGVRDLAAVQKKLNDEAGDLFKPQGKKQRLNQAIVEWQLQREQVATKLLSVTAWEEADRLRQDARVRLEELLARRSSLTQEINRHRRWQQARTLVEEIRKLENQLEPLASSSHLPEDFESRRQEMQLLLKEAETQEKSATESLESIQRELVKITVDEALLARTDELNRLFSDAGSNRKALLDRIRLLEQVELHEKTLSDLRQSQSEQSGNGVLPTTSLDRSLRTRINQLGRRQAVLAQTLQQAQTRHAHLQQQIGEVRQHLASTPIFKPLDDLKSVIRQIRNDGDLEVRLELARKEIAELEKEIQRQLGELKPWHGSINELKTVQIPTAASIQQWETIFESHRSELSLLRARLAELAFDRENLRRKITELKQEFQIPQEVDLKIARENRETLWSEIREQIVLQKFPSDSLITEFERCQSETDRLADRLRNEADRVAQLSDQLNDLKSNECRSQELSHQIAKLEDERKETETKWQGEWPDFKTSPLAPREMLTWVAQRERLLQHEAQLSRRCLEAASLLERIEDHIQWLTLQLADEDFHSRSVSISLPKTRRPRQTAKNLTRSEQSISRQQLSLFSDQSSGHGISTPETANGKPDVGLPDLLASAEKLVETDEANQRIYQQAEEDLARLLAEESDSQELILQAKNDLSEWQTQWQEAMQTLKFSPDLSPDIAMNFIETLFEIMDEQKQAEQLRKRIAEIEDDDERFHASVTEICLEIAPDLIDLKADQAISTLQTRLSNSLRDQIKFNELISQKAHFEQQLAEARQSSLYAIENVVELCDMAHIDLSVQDPHKPFASNGLTTIFRELAQAVEQSKLRADCESHLQTSRKRLLDLADPETVESFMAQVQLQTAESISLRLHQLNDETLQLASERDRLNQQLGGFDEQLRRMDGSSEAAEAQEKLQLLLAQIRSDAEQYVRIKLASSVLNSAIERYREKIRGPVLAIASDLFRELTLASFDGLQIDEDDQSKPMLVGLRAGKRDAVPVTGMSEGTCDQLYLALRLASLQLESHPRNRLPLIVDDILIQFDDARATAALRVLSQLGQHRQVIYFTHHEHLLEIARKELSVDCCIHRLNDC